MNKAFLRAVIVCGGPIKDYQRLKNSLREDDFFVFCDGGLYHQKELGFEPNLIVGDFDSYTQKTTEGLESDFPEAKIIKLPREKDDTDSIYASKYLYEAGFKNILIIGAVGERFDHTMANISILVDLYKKGIGAVIQDDYSVMKIVEEQEQTVSPEYSYFSVVSLSDECTGVSIKNAKYPLENGVIKNSYQYAVSNEVLDKTKPALVSIKKGTGLLVMDF